MEPSNSFSEDEIARKLVRVFQIFSSAQEDWVVARCPGNETGDTEKDPEVLT